MDVVAEDPEEAPVAGALVVGLGVHVAAEEADRGAVARQEVAETLAEAAAVRHLSRGRLVASPAVTLV